MRCQYGGAGVAVIKPLKYHRGNKTRPELIRATRKCVHQLPISSLSPVISSLRTLPLCTRPAEDKSECLDVERQIDWCCQIEMPPGHVLRLYETLYSHNLNSRSGLHPRMQGYFSQGRNDRNISNLAPRNFKELHSKQLLLNLFLLFLNEFSKDFKQSFRFLPAIFLEVYLLRKHP